MHKPLKVLYVVHYSIFSGPHNLIAQLGGLLRDRHCEVVVALPDEPGDAAERLRNAGLVVRPIRLHRVRASRNIRTQLDFLAGLSGDVGRLRRLITTHSPDVVLVGGFINPHAVLAANRERVPVVWQIVDSRTPRLLIRLMRPLLRSRTDAAMFWGTALIRQHAGHRELPCPVVTTPSPVDPNRFKVAPDGGRDARRELGIPPEALVVGVVGNIVPQKGLEYFVDAAARIDQACREIYFLVVGPRLPTHQDYAERIERAVAASGIDRSRFIFAGSRRDVERCFQAMTVKLMTSLPASEGIPTVIGEALACGVPVVTTRAGAAHEVVQDGINGFVVPPCDPVAIASRAVLLLRDSTRRDEMAESARRRALELFDPEVCANKHVETFRAAIAYHRRQRRMESRLRRQPG